MIINCTPHPIRVFRGDQVILEVGPSGDLARLVESELGQLRPELGPPELAKAEIPVHVVDCFGRRQVTGLPAEKHGRWVVVSLAVALVVRSREDLIVSWGPIRDESGAVVGCTGFKAIHEEWTVFSDQLVAAEVSA